MTVWRKRIVMLVLTFACQCIAGGQAMAADPSTGVQLFDGHEMASVIYLSAHKATGKLAADMLAHDLKGMTGLNPDTGSDLKACRKTCVIIGEVNDPQVRRLAVTAGIDVADLSGGWERYGRAVLTLPNGATALLIAGSDRRGMIYGVVDMTREMGVSAWEWWADVTPRRVSEITVASGLSLSRAPSVKYRGIFLNDEDWGLEPWAAKTFEPETGNIGPKTYARVYELMWRLKANTIWPAMHSISTPFYAIKANPRVADDYAIVVGTSHAEPMMRNNLREWDETREGAFNFTQNRDRILAYWRSRIEESGRYESIYTVGLRGIHDGPMQGAETPEARKTVLETVIDLQRSLLQKSLKRKPAEVPQSYILYHELQEAYDAGLKVPDDVTLVWADDNYGYIRRLSNAAEQKRAGGSGVYYHLSYWGRPHDYLWLGTTHPGLVHEEMERAYRLDARREWIVNVGDIKPAEYLTQYFLDLAFDAETFHETPRAHMTRWMAQQFGPADADAIAGIMMDYYDLAFERKPEFMGFSETEPVTPTAESDFAKADGERAQARLQAYADLTHRAEAIYAVLPEDRKAAFFELVLYPVRSAANLNARILNLDLAHLYARQGRASANLYSDRARASQARLVADTEAYNSLNDDKWRNIMDMAPRRLPVFLEPVYPQWSASTVKGCEMALSGGWWNDENALTFVQGQPRGAVITVFSQDASPRSWTLNSENKSLNYSVRGGHLDQANGYEQRITVTYDGGAGAGAIDLTCDKQALRVHTKILSAARPAAYVEQDRHVRIRLGDQTDDNWERITGLGFSGVVIRSRLDHPGMAKNSGTPLTYGFSSFSETGGTLQVVALPTHPLTRDVGVRIAVQLDDGEVTVMDFATVGRSDQWRQNVLTNTATGTLAFKRLQAGLHTLKIWPLDPGVMLDYADIRLDGAGKYYGTIP